MINDTEQNNTEQFKPVVGYEGFYEVTDLGRVISYKREKPKFLRLLPNTNGALQVKLTDGVNPSRRPLVARLVMEAFSESWDKDLTVDHIDGDRSNNRLSNLRMLTIDDNRRAFQKRRSNGSSRYRGVFYHQGHPTACIGYNGKAHRLGRFDTEEEAALAYNAKAIELGYLPEALNQVP